MEASDTAVNIRKNGARPHLEHVVFLMTADERKLFFEDAHFRVENALHRETWLDVSGRTTEGIEAVLRELSPTVLVTAWSCPPLPEAWGLEDESPIRYVCSTTGSVKPRVPRSWIEKGILVSNWGALVSEAVAEHAFLMVMALLRSLPLWSESMQTQWTAFDMMPRLRSRVLRGKRVGLHGFGAVARELVAMLRPFDVEIEAYSQGVPPSLFEEFGVQSAKDLASLCARSEILIECEGLNDWSRGSVTEEVLRLMPRDSVFVNVGRAAVVDEAALAKLAREGHLRVGLDVFTSEPLPIDSPLLEQSGILLSPHVAGPTWETYPECGRTALRNLRRYLRGEQVENLVTPEIYDRAT